MVINEESKKNGTKETYIELQIYNCVLLWKNKNKLNKLLQYITSE
jgi:hypothetical protein